MKQTRIYSVLFNKCPRCHEGPFFKENSAYKLRSFSLMHDQCPECREDFHRETGFYYGAMYASYGLTVLFGVLVFLFSQFLLGLDIWYFLIGYSLSVIALLPVFFRWSRLIWINLFVGPDKKTSLGRKI